MHVHLIGVAGTGMGALAGLLRKAGHRTTGSDAAFYPPMGDALVRWGVGTRLGFDPAHLSPPPDLVVIGNVARSTNSEARAAIDRGLRYTSLPGALAEMFLSGRQSYVVAGTHGKTTVSALLAFLLHRCCGEEPGFLVGGIPRDFEESFALGAQGAPFVVEGDEYDSAFFEKSPKFWQYKPWAAILTSVEHDHMDIYPTMEEYRAAFAGFVERIPADGLLVAFAGDPEVRAVARGAKCRTHWYALTSDDCGGILPEWLVRPAAPDGGVVPLDVFVRGLSFGRATSPLSGLQNARNVLAALALAVEGARVPIDALVSALASFRGVKRRQELLGVPAGVRVYDDFAHHPTAVRETLAGLRAMHPDGSLIAVFEPRTATASRRLHQDEYAAAFSPANVTMIAPVGRSEVPAGERLDVQHIAAEIRQQGRIAEAGLDAAAIVTRVVDLARQGDTVVVMSNGAFDGIHQKLLATLASVRSVAAP